MNPNLTGQTLLKKPLKPLTSFIGALLFTATICQAEQIEPATSAQTIEKPEVINFKQLAASLNTGSEIQKNKAHSLFKKNINDIEFILKLATELKNNSQNKLFNKIIYKNRKTQITLINSLNFGTRKEIIPLLNPNIANSILYQRTRKNITNIEKNIKTIPEHRKKTLIEQKLNIFKDYVLATRHPFGKPNQEYEEVTKIDTINTDNLADEYLHSKKFISVFKNYIGIRSQYPKIRDLSTYLIILKMNNQNLFDVDKLHKIINSDLITKISNLQKLEVILDLATDLSKTDLTKILGKDFFEHLNLSINNKDFNQLNTLLGNVSNLDLQILITHNLTLKVIKASFSNNDIKTLDKMLEDLTSLQKIFFTKEELTNEVKLKMLIKLSNLYEKVKPDK